MRTLFRLLLPVLLIVLCLVSLALFRSVPVTRIWKGYSVLSVESSVPEAVVLARMAEHGCEGVISLSLQKEPVASPIVPVQIQSGGGYLEQRLSYFSDEGGRFRLFYVPDAFEKETVRALDALSKETGAAMNMDGKSRYPFLVPLLTFSLWLLLGTMSRNKVVFAVPSLFVVLLTLSQPFYAVAAPCALLLLAMLLAQCLWGRRDMFKALAANRFVLVPAVAAIVLLAANGLRAAGLSFAVCAASVSAVSLLAQWHRAKENRASFVFVPIFSARRVYAMNAHASLWVLVVAAMVLVFLLLFLGSARFAPSFGVAEELSLPSPVASDEPSRRLPSFSDYMDWAWAVVSFPYRSLHDGPVDSAWGEEVTMPHFRERNGAIEAYSTVVLRYDEDFAASVEKSVSQLSYPAIEKLLAAQGRNVQVSYSTTASGGERRDGISLALLVAALCIPLGMYAFYFFWGRKTL